MCLLFFESRHRELYSLTDFEQARILGSIRRSVLRDLRVLARRPAKMPHFLSTLPTFRAASGRESLVRARPLLDLSGYPVQSNSSMPQSGRQFSNSNQV